MESLRRLVNVGSFSVLQDKLERWLDDYALNTSDLNANRCCEVIELNARVQAQLFRLLDITSAGSYGGSAALRARLLPWTGNGLWPNYLWPESTWGILEESYRKDRQITDLQDTYDQSLRSLEDELTVTQDEATDLQKELEDTKAVLDEERRQSSSTKMFSESEARELRNKLVIAENELAVLKPRVGLIEDYERQIRNLRDDITILTSRRNLVKTELMNVQNELLSMETQLGNVQRDNHKLKMELIDTKDLALSDLSSDRSKARNGDFDLPLKSSLSRRSYSPLPLPRPTSPLAPDDVTQRVRQANLVNRFNDMFAQDRLDAMDTLRKFSDDYEMNQRILFVAMQESFTSAKLAFSTYKMRVRSNLAVTHFGPESLEEAVQDYINRHTDMCDLPGMVSDVIRALNRNPKLYLTPDVSFTIIQPFIREACKLAWNMSALASPLDITVACDVELFEDCKYRRSYDSEYSAPLVKHHIWPCLMQGIKVLVKGEACTRRGASMQTSVSPVRSRASSPIRSRSASPLRSLSPSRVSRARSRSPSPRRKMDTSLSGRTSPLRSASPSRASSRAVTTSTALSHYGVHS